MAPVLHVVDVHKYSLVAQLLAQCRIQGPLGSLGSLVRSRGHGGQEVPRDRQDISGDGSAMDTGPGARRGSYIRRDSLMMERDRERRGKRQSYKETVSDRDCG